eukprot:2550579-Amphidinium_carterae.2
MQGVLGKGQITIEAFGLIMRSMLDLTLLPYISNQDQAHSLAKVINCVVLNYRPAPITRNST